MPTTTNSNCYHAVDHVPVFLTIDVALKFDGEARLRGGGPPLDRDALMMCVREGHKRGQFFENLEREAAAVPEDAWRLLEERKSHDAQYAKIVEVTQQALVATFPGGARFAMPEWME